MKIALDLNQHHIPYWLRTNSPTTRLTKALPFFKSSGPLTKYHHRVRSARAHWRNGHLDHTSVTFWCGGSGFIGNGKGRLYSEVPENEVMCATCEGRAVGAGLTETRRINGKFVLFMPRIKEET